MLWRRSGCMLRPRQLQKHTRTRQVHGSIWLGPHLAQSGTTAWCPRSIGQSLRLDQACHSTWDWKSLKVSGPWQPLMRGLKLAACALVFPHSCFSTMLHSSRLLEARRADRPEVGRHEGRLFGCSGSHVTLLFIAQCLAASACKPPMLQCRIWFNRE